MKHRLGVAILFVVVLILVAVGHAPGETAVAQTAFSATQQVTSAIATGGLHTCAMMVGGGAKCWGWNASGQLGDGTETRRLTPVDVVGISNDVSAIAAGYYHTCALTTGGSVKCWGHNDNGQLGDDTANNSPTPVDVVGLSSGVSAVSAGGFHTCALTSAGGVKCWGSNNSGQLGDDTTNDSPTPVNVVGLSSGVSAVSAGGFHACALTSAGGVKCWGNNNSGQLGDGTWIRRLEPVDVVSLGSGVSAISAGLHHTCALTTGGSLKCWGLNGDGQLGDDTTNNSPTPVDVVGLGSGVSTIGAGGHHSCVLTSAGGVKCWGSNNSGQLGDGTETRRLTPVDVVGLSSGVSAIGAGGHHSGALMTGGGIACWGFNNYGQLGVGDTSNSSTPVDVVGLESSSANIALKLRVEDAPDDARVRKSRGSFVDIVAELTGDQASDVGVTLEVAGDALGAPLLRYVRQHAGDGGGEAPQQDLGNGRYQIEATLEETTLNNQTVYYQEAIWRFQVPVDAAYGNILLNISATSSAGDATDSVRFDVVDHANAIVVTSRNGLFREYGQGTTWSNVKALLQEVYRAAAQQSGEVFYIERYAVVWTQTENESAANAIVEGQIDPLIEQWHATLTSDSLAFVRPVYLLIVGGDEIIPFYRADDDDYQLSLCLPNVKDCEGDYWAEGQADSGVLWDAYADNYFLTDNIYADLGGNKRDWENGDLELALGRIVGNNALEMGEFIRNGLNEPAPLEQAGLSSVGGSDIGDMQSALTGKSISLLGLSDPDLTENNSWNPEQFEGEWSKEWQFFYIGGHGTPRTVSAPSDDENGFSNIRLQNDNIDVGHPLLLSGTCNFAVPIPGRGSRTNVMVKEGVSGIVGSTGLVDYNPIPFGMTWGGEKLDNIFVEKLLSGRQSTVRFGEALRWAKRDFNPTNSRGRKAMLEYVYYGLPWAYMDIAGGSGLQTLSRQSSTAHGDMPPAFVQAGATNGSYHVVVSADVADYTLEQVEGYDLLVVDGAEIVVDPEQPALPYVVKTVTLPAGSSVDGLSWAGENEVPLGVKALPAITPVTTYDTTSGIAAFTGTGLYPSERWTLQVVYGPDQTEVEILVYLATYDADTQELTLYDSTDLRLHYTTAASAVLQNLELDQKSYLPGDTVQAAAEVQNITDQSRSYTAQLTLLDANGAVISETESAVFSVASGTVQPVVVNSTAVDAAGPYLALLEILEASTLVEGDKESFNVSDGAVTAFQVPAEVMQGQESDVVLTFSNYRQGAVDVSAEIAILDLGIEVGRLSESTATVAAGAAGNITWQWDPQNIASGTYTLQAVVSVGETYYDVALAEVTVKGICQRLTLEKIGNGAVPVASPARSAQCNADGRYVAGEPIQLSGANADDGYQISGWTGTDHDGWKTATNEVTMPGHDHTVTVNYGQLPAAGALIYLTPTVKATVNGVTYEDEDIVAHDVDADSWSLFFDGSDVGLKSAKLNAFYILDDGTLLMSFHKAMKTLPGLEGIQVDDSDIVRFWPESMGEDTAGFFEMYFDGSDVELTTGGEDIDAISFDENGKLIISTLSRSKVGALRFGDEDLMRFDATSLYENTAGTWEMYFDSSDIDRKLGDIAGTWIDSASGDILFAVTPKWAYAAGGLTINTYDIGRCTPNTLGEDTSCTTIEYFWQGAAHGFGTSKHKIDGLHIGTAAYELPTICYRLNVGHSGWGVDPLVSPVKSAGCAEDGRYVAGESITLSEADAADDWDIVGWSGTDNDASTASNNGLAMPASNHAVQVNYGYNKPVYLSPLSAVTVDGVRYEDEDILKYDSETGTWSLYFDGSDVGLASRDVNGFYLEQSGDLLLTFDKAVSNLNGSGGVWDDSDIVRFTPTALGDTTAGTFALLFDGSDVGLTTGGEDIDAIAYDAAGNLVISTTSSGKAGTLPMADEDLLRFTATSLGETTTGTWEMYFDGSDIDKKLSDISGSWIDAATGNILFAVDKKWVYDGVTANTYDILSCAPGSLGTDTSCTTVNFFWQGADHGFGSRRNKIDGLSLTLN